VAPPPAVLALRNIWVHIHTSNDSNKTTNVEAAIDDVLYQRTTLGIPDINPNYSHIGFGKSFDNSRL